MKVLYLTNLASPYRTDFFNELGKDIDLTVLFERKSASNREDKWLNNNFKRFKSVFLEGLKIGTEASFSFKVIKYLNKKYDVIVIGGYSTPTAMLAISYLKLRKIPFILNADGGIIKKDGRIKFKIKKFFLESAHKYICSGEKTSEYLKYYGAKKSRIFKYPFTSLKEADIISKVVDTKEKINLKKELGMKEEKIVLSVGQFIHRKGFDVLLKASKQLDKNTGIYIIGGKPTKDYLKLKRDLKLENVYFIDFKSKEELKKYYKASDLFVLPTREDIWGLVINEAMAHALPVITTDKCIAGLELIKADQGGYIIETDNSKLLNEKISEILLEDNKRKEMSEYNLLKIKDYTIKKMAKEHINIFENCY